tara:strand:+ start:1141 stop:2028 length:888 start_codon:yes stop_codon:yes gene_type:complete
MQELLTQTEIVTFGKCEKRWEHRYVSWLTPFVESMALSMGSAFHEGLDAGNPEAAVDYLDKQDPAWGQWEDGKNRVNKAIAHTMVSAALKQWQSWPDKSEFQFQLGLPKPGTGNVSKKHRLSGVWDGVWEGSHPRFPGEVVLGEWKTASIVNNDYMQRLDIDFQVSAYLWVASKLYGKPVTKMVYRVVKKPTIRQRKNETEEEYIDRLRQDYEERPEHYLFETVVERTEEQLDEWHKQAWAVHSRMLQIKRGDVPAIKNTQACLSRGRCPYFDLCVGAVTEDAFKRLETKHREIN